MTDFNQICLQLVIHFGIYDLSPFFILILYYFFWSKIFKREIKKYPAKEIEYYNLSYDFYDLSRYKPEEISGMLITSPLATINSYVNINPVK